MNSEIRIRQNASSNDLKLLLEIIAEEGWSTSHVDLNASLEVDASGLLIAEDLSGVLGFIGVFNMSPGLTYITAFIVRRDQRGKGVGKKLWSAMLNAASGNNLVLDGAAPIKDWYKEHGFYHEAYYSTFCSGIITSKEFMADHSVYNIVPLSEELWPTLIEYDSLIYPYSRERVLRAWFHGPDTYSVVALHDKRLVGYANFHWKSENHCNIRALYADNQDVADALLVNLLKKIHVGSKAAFNLLSDKPLPKYFADFNRFQTAHRLFTREISPVQTDKILFNTTHMV